MNSPSSSHVEVTEHSEIASQLLAQAAILTRLVAKQVSAELSRTEASILNTLTIGSRRITELAELAGLAQPTTTLLVKRLEHRGWVQRERQDYDGRIVMVSLTRVGNDVLEDYRSRFAGALRTSLAEVASEEEIGSLVLATETLDSLIILLQGRRR
jgi:DNA-binding MarR family transcriptional regulator